MALYHASRLAYECAQTVTLIGFNDFSATIRAEGKEWVEEILESSRPPAHTPRREALYAFDSIDACARFAAGEERKRSTGRLWQFYEVEMIEPSRHPIHLVYLIWKLDLDEGDELACQISSEYWTPAHSWSRCEYLSREMTIRRIVAPTQLFSDDLARALADRDLSYEVWPSIHLAGPNASMV
jgi:hypothetical protein